MDSKNIFYSYDQDVYTTKNLNPSNHVCSIFYDQNEFKSYITDFIINGLNENQKIVYVTNPDVKEQICTYLHELKIRPQDYINKGQLAFYGTNDVFLGSEIFNPSKMIEMLKGECVKAEQEGYSALRATGEMCWALKNQNNIELLIEYEARLNNDFFNHFNCVGLCQYDARLFNPEVLNHIIDVHPLCHIRGSVYPNQFYIPSQDYLGKNKVSQILDRKIDQIITQKKREQAVMSLYKQVEELRQFGYMAAHDLKSPIQKAHIFTGLLKAEHESELTPDAQLIVNKSMKFLNEANNRLESLQDLGNIANSKRAQNFLNVNELIEEIIDDYRSLLKNVKGQIFFKSHAIFSLKMGKNHFTQLFFNLLDNCIKYKNSTRPLEIQISTFLKNSHTLQIQIQDNGIGLEDNQQQKIFQPFYRLHSSEEISGMGLGLTICQRIVHKYDGEIKAQGGSLKEGTLISLTFPIDNSSVVH